MTTRRANGRKLGGGTLWISIAAALGGLLAGLWYGSLRKPEPVAVARHAESVPSVPEDIPRSPEELPEETASPISIVPVTDGRVAIVIDDLGRRLSDVDRVAALSVPVSVAVLPFETRTGEVLAELRRRGIEILCHMPMESRTGANAGPGALTLKMNRWGLRRSVVAALDAVPEAVGVSNHMGSGFAGDEKRMRRVLSIVAERGLFYLDSRTSADSVGYPIAVRLGMPAAQRQVFLDADPLREAVRDEFVRTLGLARTRGSAIALGHPHETTLDVLEEEIPRALRAGYEFVPVSSLLYRPSDE